MDTDKLKAAGTAYLEAMKAPRTAETPEGYRVVMDYLAASRPTVVLRLIAEVEAGRALLAAVRESGGIYGPEVGEAVEAYKAVLDAK